MGNVNEACATASVCQDCQAPNNDRVLTRQEDRPFGLPSLEALSRVQQISIHKPSRPAHLPPESGLDRASSPARLPWESRLPHGSVSKQFGAESPEAPSRPASRRHQYEEKRGWQGAGVQNSRVLRKTTGTRSATHGCASLKRRLRYLHTLSETETCSPAYECMDYRPRDTRMRAPFAQHPTRACRKACAEFC